MYSRTQTLRPSREFPRLGTLFNGVRAALKLPTLSDSSQGNQFTFGNPYQVPVLYVAFNPTPNEIRNIRLPDESLGQFMVSITTADMVYNLRHVRYSEGLGNETNRSFVYVNASADDENIKNIGELVEGDVIKCINPNSAMIALRNRLTQAQVAALIDRYREVYDDVNITVPFIIYRNPPRHLLQSASPSSLEARLEKLDLSPKPIEKRIIQAA